MSFLDERPPELPGLEVDALELSFQDAVFALDGDSIHCRDGKLMVANPSRIQSAGIHLVPLQPGSMILRLAVDDEILCVPVLALGVNYLEVAESHFRGLPVDEVEHLCPGRLEYEDEFGEEVLSVDVVFEDVGATGNRRLGFINNTQERLDLVRIYRRLRYPNLVDRGSLTADAVVRLFHESEYLKLRDSCTSPNDAWCCPDFAAAISEDVLYRATDGALLGHISITRAYSRAWVGHQFTTLRGHGESAQCRIALYGHCISIPSFVDGIDEEAFLVSYYNREKLWHRVFFDSFCEWVGDENLVSVVPFDRFEPVVRDVRMLPPLDPSDSIEVRECRDYELEAVEYLVRQQLPEIACDAFDIEANRLVASHLHKGFEEQGVERSRRVIVVLEEQRIVGAALLELSYRNLSLFNLFNMAQIYFDPHAIVSRRAQAELVRRAREEFAKRGVLDPVIAARPGVVLHPEDAGILLEETMGCIVWTSEALLFYQSYLRYCFESRIGAIALKWLGIKRDDMIQEPLRKMG